MSEKKSEKVDPSWLFKLLAAIAFGLMLVGMFVPDAIAGLGRGIGSLFGNLGTGIFSFSSNVSMSVDKLTRAIIIGILVFALFQMKKGSQKKKGDDDDHGHPPAGGDAHH